MSAPWSRLPAFVRGASRLVRASLALATLALLCLVVNMAHPVLPWAVLWLWGPIGSILMAVACWRTSQAAHLPMPTRRFWRHLFLVAVFVGLGVTSQAVDVLSASDPSGTHLPLAMQLSDGTAVLIVVFALFRLPFGEQTSGDVLRVVLDAGTVMLACAFFMWHFQTRGALNSGDSTDLYISLTLTVLALLAVFAVAKFLLTRHVHVDPVALRYIGVAVFTGTALPMLRPFLIGLDAHLFPDVISTPFIFCLGALAAERQFRATYATRRGVVPVRRNPFSLMPYLAVAAVDGLLLVITWRGNDPDQRVAVGVAVLLTALVVLRQITAFRDNARLLRRLDHGATHDGLTQLPNRVLFHERLDKALTTPGDRPVSVALIDLDDFKEVNDTLGHEVGDLLLIAVAQRLNSCVRVEDTVARLGGDEFVVVLDGADPDAADLAAQRMIEALRQPVVADGHELPIRASIGIADGRSGDDPSVLLRHADIAMYAAKNISGTASLHYDTAMSASGVDHAHLGAELRQAIQGEQLFLLYQPIVDLNDGRVLGAEALVRWAHPAHGTLAPDSFIPVAERTGLIVPLGRWVLRSALSQLATWMRTHGADAPEVLNINVSARDLREPGFAGAVRDLLDEFAIAGDRITLEVTESMTVEPGESITNLHDLRALGVRVSLDDFGTGHSTLTLLHDCPVDEIKLDRSFTQAPADGRIRVATAVIQLAKALGLHAVAEGVETPEQVQELLGLGYVAAQGYYFARPMPADRFSSLLDTGVTLTPVAA
ncbi:putative bifunctional diguanylate cyclase/phosphodiesterase [Micromonosporaceae bacterium Da 78-11]